MSLKLHLEFIKLSWASRMAYRVDFIVSILAMIFFQLTGPLFIGTIYYAGATFPGWNFAQVLMLQGTISLIMGISFMTFFGILWHTQMLVREGNLDTMLIRPVNALWLLVMSSFDDEDVGQVIGGVIITATAAFLLGWELSNLFTFIVFGIAGILFYFSLAVLSSALCIRFVKVNRLYEFVNLIKIFGSYPKDIYSPKLAAAFTFIIPLFITAHYPASALIGFSISGAYTAILSTIIWLVVCVTIWYRTIRHYSGAGG